MAGVGLRLVCLLCNIVLHRYCQNCPVSPTCRLHDRNDRVQTRRHKAKLCVLNKSRMSNIRSFLGTTALDEICIFCGDEIPNGARYYACADDPTCVAHPTCFLVLKRTASTFADYRNVVDSKGHVLRKHDGGRYSCATCGDRGFGICLRCDTCTNLRDHHPFCIESSRLDRNRACSRHHDQEMAWKPPPRFMNRPKCGVCLKKIAGHHYLCGGVTEEGGRAIHAMCAERLRQDRKYDRTRQALRYCVEALTLGFMPLGSGGQGVFYDRVIFCRSVVFLAVTNILYALGFPIPALPPMHQPHQ